MPESKSQSSCILALEDGTYVRGRSFGAAGTQTGEVVFNTSMTGYQEILTDPSYYGQIATMTYPLIGNYGVNREDVESARPHVRGFIVKEVARRHSNQRATLDLPGYLADHDIVAIEGVDTRALTKKIRAEGAMRGIITTEIDDPRECVRRAAESASMVGADLVHHVAPNDCSTWTIGLHESFGPQRTRATKRRRVTAIDCGMKRNILRHLVSIGCEVRIVPPTTPAAMIMEDQPDGIFVSNGPGDPAAVHYAVELLKQLIGQVPIFGICLGHQLLGLALGAETFKLKFGHRGGNQPVKNLHTDRVEITSQNHGFAIERKSLDRVGGVATHVNLNDDTLEGFAHKDLPLLAVQYHPEASPGPHDASYLFDCFATMMDSGQAPTAEQVSDAQLNAVPHSSQRELPIS